MIRCGNRRQRVAMWAIGLFAMGFSVEALAAKPVATTFAYVNITVGDQTFGFSGAEKSFSQSATGGSIVFDVRQLSTPGYVPLPQVDTQVLEPTGNHWQIQSNVGTHSNLFVGTCASETYTTIDSGITVRHLNLNCKDLNSQ